jgi:hypothetical protein
MYFRNTMGIPTLKLKMPFGYASTNFRIKKENFVTGMLVLIVIKNAL